MKKMLFGLTVLATSALLLTGAAPADKSRSLKVRFVDFKKCIEVSSMGLEEKTNFESMKKKMEGTLEERQKELGALATKLNDPDYLDSLSPDAETELKRKWRQSGQELAELENQSYQVLNQTHFKVIQKLTENVGKAAESVAKKEGYDFIVNEESCFFATPDFDITDAVVKEMDKIQTEAKKGA